MLAGRGNEAVRFGLVQSLWFWCVAGAGPVGLGTCGLGFTGDGVSRELPASLVQECVVVAAHENEVVQCGWSAVVS